MTTATTTQMAPNGIQRVVVVQVADQFVLPIPQAFLEDPEVAEWCRVVTLLLDDLTSPDGAISTGEETAETVLTQGEKLDLITVSQDVNLDTIEADTATNKTAIEKIATSSPDYTISNDGTERTLNADGGLITAGLTYSQTDFQQLIDHVGELSDFTATMNRDLQNKDIFS